MPRRTTSLGGMLDRMSGNTGIQEPVQEPRNPAPPIETPQPAGGIKKVTFDFPADFARDLKMHCVAEGITMRDYVLRAIRQYQATSDAAGKDAPSAEFTGRQPPRPGV